MASKVEPDKALEDEVALLDLEKSDDLAKLKIIKRQRKAAVTRTIGAIGVCVADRDPSEVKSKLSTLTDQFVNFTYVHDIFYDSIDDDEEYIKAEEMFNSAQAAYAECVSKARNWLDMVDENGELKPLPPPQPPVKEETVTVVSNTDSSNESKIQIDSEMKKLNESMLNFEQKKLEHDKKMLDLLSLPSKIYTKFDGNPLRYPAFEATVNDEIMSKDVPDGIKLSRIIEMCEADALRSIRNCPAYGTPEEGLKECLKILKERYGADHILTQALIRSLRSTKTVNKPLEIRDLYDDLRLAQKNLDKLSLKSDFENQELIKNTVKRCPSYIANLWRKKVFSVLEAESKYPTFEQFVEFFKKVSTQANDPLYGQEYWNEMMNKKSSSGSGGSNVFSSVGSSKTQKCVHCSGDHSLHQCESFIALSPKDRLAQVRQKRLCFLCLRAGHRSVDCRLKQIQCTVPGCAKRSSHNTLIHIPIQERQSPAADTGSGTSGAPKVGQSGVVPSKKLVYQPIVPVTVSNGELSMKVFALKDSGANTTYASDHLSNMLRLEGPVVSHLQHTMSGSGDVSSKLVNCEITSMTGERFSLNNVLVQSDMQAPFPAQYIDVEKYPWLKDIPLTTVGHDVKVDLIIGMDRSDLTVPLEYRRHPADRSAPYAVNTPLGWMLHGPVDSSWARSQPAVGKMAYTESLPAIIDEDMYEEVSPAEDFTDGMSRSEEKVLEFWGENLVMKDGHFELPIPWKNFQKPSFPDNRHVALKRLNSLKHKLLKQGKFDEYAKGMQNFIDNDYVEEVPLAEVDLNDGSVFYMPHHGVSTEAKPKLRICFDALTEYEGFSVNNQTLQGPDMINPLRGVLLRFMQYEHAFQGDIKQMYLQCRVPENERNTLRFLWFKNGKIVHYRLCVHFFGGRWCSAASAFCLRKAADTFSPTPLVRELIYKSFYVDDCTSSHQKEREMEEVLFGAKNTLIQAAMDLTKIVSNSQTLMEKVPEVDRAPEAKVIGENVLSKTLGVRWDVSRDCLYYVNRLSYFDSRVTKRQMLRIGKMYCPLGWIQPILHKGKLIFQEACRENIGWDDPVPEHLDVAWRAWVDSLQKVSELIFPRCIMTSEYISSYVELHSFSDGGLYGFGAVSYLRLVSYSTGSIKVHLLAGKSRLCPIKQISVPRSELCGAVENVKLSAMIKEQLTIKVSRCIYWTDSKILLGYLRNEHRRFKVYVANRVGTILRHSEASEWLYVPSNENPADVATKGCTVSDLPDSWINGPEFLKVPQEWKDRCSEEISVEVSEMEMHPGKPEAVSNQVSAEVNPLDRLMNHYSSFYRLKKAVVYLKRFCKYLKDKRNPKKAELITVSELHDAEHVLLSHVQSTALKEDIKNLKKNGKVNQNSSLSRLCPFIHKDGLLRVGGKLGKTSLTLGQKHQVIIPKDHRIGKLIVHDYHNATHVGTNWLLSLILNKYWIVRIKSYIKYVKRSCVVCRRLYASPEQQYMADLPLERCLSGNPPFSFVGVDLFGPLYAVQGRSQVKRYGCIYSCMNTRGCHLELLDSLDTESFILGLRRFLSRRGCPKKVYSDNGSNLVSAHKEIKLALKQLDKEKVINEARQNDIEWHFNPPLASNFGGFYERMIRSVRSILAAQLSSPVPKMTTEVMRTIFCEVEAILNSRPITKVSLDIDDDSYLTPNHLILLKGYKPMSWGDDIGKSYRSHWQIVRKFADDFWKRWVKSYLPALQSRQKWLSVRRNLKKGDLVLMVDECQNRGFWNLALVDEVYPSSDGLVRSVAVKTAKKSYDRPVNKLVLLEGAE